VDRTDRLTIDDDTREARMSGILLAEENNEDDPISGAWSIVKEAGLESGDCATVSSGDSGKVGRASVILLHSADKAPDTACSPLPALERAFSARSSRAAARKKPGRKRKAPKKAVAPGAGQKAGGARKRPAKGK
jgi:hypothetical protein